MVAEGPIIPVEEEWGCEQGEKPWWEVPLSEEDDDEGAAGDMPVFSPLPFTGNEEEEVFGGWNH